MLLVYIYNIGNKEHLNQEVKIIFLTNLLFFIIFIFYSAQTIINTFLNKLLISQDKSILTLNNLTDVDNLDESKLFSIETRDENSYITTNISFNCYYQGLIELFL